MYSITNLAEEFSITPRALRHYETLGLLNPTRQGNRRFYDLKQHARLALICRGRRLGFSLVEIKEFLKLYTLKGQEHDQMAFLYKKSQDRVKDLTAQKKDIDLTLEELIVIQAELKTYLQPPKRS